MCGIIGFAGNEPASPIVLQGLIKLEYRGYDSAGVASIYNGHLLVQKDIGRIVDIDRRLGLKDLPGNVAIAHTRWATHGGVTRKNAHPHIDCAGSIAVVHNGIVENYVELRRGLEEKGHTFASETDTEVIPHIIEECLKENITLEQTVLATVRQIKGSYAIMVISEKEPDKIIATRKDNPLVIGTGERGTFATSDMFSLTGCTGVIYPENGDLAVLTSRGVEFFDGNGQPVTRTATPLNTTEQCYDKGDYEHFMLKEIMAEPEAILTAINQDERSFTQMAMDILRARQVVISACGTSRYAGLVGRYLFSGIANKFCDVVMASEFQYFSESIDKNTLVIAVSQSGETADVIEGVKRSKDNGARVISIVNRPNSMLCRMSDDVIYLNCGPEIAVAATKSLTSQLAIFYLLSYSMINQFSQGVAHLKNVANEVSKVLSWNGAKLEKLSEQFKDARDFYYIARGVNFPIASEAALKLKEISYIHAEGLPAGELKHGTLALIEDRTPVVAICPNDNTFHETLDNGIEAKARGAYIIGVSDIIDPLYDFWIEIPKVESLFYPLVSIAPLHLLAYYLALKRGEDPDKPRNLAKSVTVK
ncbi:MAG: glutamine--fructose-6-phosphate transaminase (isomerizing) [Dehalococcoidales bacterium]|jgi:glucosamine--fructose-6-phosphate aminotransferase (isomerizing)